MDFARGAQLTCRARSMNGVSEIGTERRAPVSNWLSRVRLIDRDHAGEHDCH